MIERTPPQEQVRHVRYEAEPDTNTEDPREWVAGAMPELRVYRSDWNGQPDIEQAEHPALRVFARVLSVLGDADRALRAARLWVAIFGNDESIHMAAISGASQSDWWNTVCIDEDDAGARAMTDTWATWARGDVWIVTQITEVKCNLGHFHVETQETLGGIYAEDSEDAIDVYLGDHGGPHEWGEPSRFGGNILCKRCNLLPLGPEDAASTCHGTKRKALL